VEIDMMAEEIDKMADVVYNLLDCGFEIRLKV
jgi:hypothetical protein